MNFSQFSHPNPMDLWTAWAHLALFFSLAFSSIPGENTFSIFILCSTSSRFCQKPTCRPAAIAAPMPVISAVSLRTIWAFMKSAYVCIMKLFTVMPPSTDIFVTCLPESLAIESTTSHVRRQGASSIDLTRCPFCVLDPNPIQRPLASSRQYGEKIP